jgi:hypothetical protein
MESKQGLLMEQRGNQGIKLRTRKAEEIVQKLVLQKAAETQQELSNQYQQSI